MNRKTGAGTVFSFTFKNQIRSKGYKVITWLIAILFFALPAGIMPLVEYLGSLDNEPKTTQITEVYVCDRTENPVSSVDVLKEIGDVYNSVNYTVADNDPSSSYDLINSNNKALLLIIDKKDNTYSLSMIKGDNCELESDDISSFTYFVEQNFRVIIASKYNISQEQISDALYTSVSTGSYKGVPQIAAEDPLAKVKEVVSMVLPYLTLLIVYFLVVFYGQNVANIVVMEKQSKLMDTFLVSVSPFDVIFGKVFAIVAASIMQVLIWVIAVVGGFVAGSAFVRMINPDSTMVLLQLFNTIGLTSEMFSIASIIGAVVLIIIGFAMYCAIASIGGSAASKTADLASTNTLFTMIILVSFFVAIYNGALSGKMPVGLSPLDLIPFTAIMITPGRAMTGMISLPELGISIAITLVVTILFIWIAARVYRMMSLYKGDVPKIGQLVEMFKADFSSSKKEN